MFPLFFEYSYKTVQKNVIKTVIDKKIEPWNNKKYQPST